MVLAEKELENQLKEAGSRLLDPPIAIGQLLPLLDQVENCLSRVDQSPSESMLKALFPSTSALISNKLLKHSDTDVQVAVASCLSEITRITAPDAPYEDGVMKNVFQMIVAAFEKLYDMHIPSYSKRVSILETVAKVRSCVVMLDLECDELICEMFNHFLNSIREEHPDNIFLSMETIMTLVLEESEDISTKLLHCLLSSVNKKNKAILSVARRLGEKVIGNCAGKIKPYLLQEVKSSGLNLDDYVEVVASACQESIIPTEQDSLNDSAQKSVDESSQFEVIVVNEPTKVAEKIQPELACPKEADPLIDESPKSLLSNGTVLEHDGNSVNQISLQHTVDPSYASCPSEMAIGTEGGLKNLDSTKIGQVETTKDQATRKKRVKKSNSTHSTDNSDRSGMECIKSELASRKRVPSKESNSSVSEVPFVKGTTGPTENEKKTGFSPPTASPNEISHVAVSPDSASVPDSTTRKRGRHAKTKGDAKSDLVPNVSSAGKMQARSSNHTVDEGQEHTNLKPKNSDGNNDANTKMGRDLMKKVGVERGDVDHNVQNPDISSKKESEVLSDSEVKEPRSSGNNVCMEEANDGELSVKEKQKGGQRRNLRTLESKSGGLRKMNANKTIPSNTGTAESIKDESPMEDTPKVKSKRKRPSVEKDFGVEIVGRRIKVWWPDDATFYDGKVESFDPTHKKHNIVYEDGDKEILLLKNERWEFIDIEDKENSSELKTPDASDLVLKKREIPSEPSTKRVKIDSSKNGKRGGTVKKSKVDVIADDASISRSKTENEVEIEESEETPIAACKSVDENSITINSANGISGKAGSGSAMIKESRASGKGKFPSTAVQETQMESSTKKIQQERNTKRAMKKLSQEGNNLGGGEKVSEESEIKSNQKKISQEREMKSDVKQISEGKTSAGKKITQESKIGSAGKKSEEGKMKRGGKKISGEDGVKTDGKKSQGSEIETVGKGFQEGEIKGGGKNIVVEGTVKSSGKKRLEGGVKSCEKKTLEEGAVKSGGKKKLLESGGKKTLLEGGGKKTLLEDGTVKSDTKKTLEDGAVESHRKKTLEDGAVKSGRQKALEDFAVKSGRQKALEDFAVKSGRKKALEDGAIKSGGKKALEDGSINSGRKKTLEENTVKDGGKKPVEGGMKTQSGGKKAILESVAKDGEKSLDNIERVSVKRRRGKN